MIVLNSTKELIKVESWAEIEARAGFTTNLDPKSHTLDAIIGRYMFPDRIRCGLSNCHTPHAKGYIVATKDGRETNIGKDCGQTYFGVDFETLSRKFDRDILEKENRERLWSFSFHLDELKQKIDGLRSQENGANWVYRQRRSLIESGKECPSQIVRQLASMVKTRQPVLTIEREATSPEINQLEAAQGRRVKRPHYISEPIAEIVGLEALYLENDLKELLVVELQENIKKFEEEDIDQLSFEALRRWAKWIGAVEATLERALSSIASGRRLLVASNLEPLARVVLEPEGVAQFKKYIKSLPTEAQ
jgi:hypothetical protein